MNLGWCYLLLEQVDKAVDFLRKAQATSPHLWYASFFLAGALGLRGDIDEAKAALAQAIKLKPEINSLAAWGAASPWGSNPEYSALRDKTLVVGLAAPVSPRNNAAGVVNPAASAFRNRPGGRRGARPLWVVMPGSIDRVRRSEHVFDVTEIFNNIWKKGITTVLLGMGGIEINPEILRKNPGLEHLIVAESRRGGSESAWKSQRVSEAKAKPVSVAAKPGHRSAENPAQHGWSWLVPISNRKLRPL
jgi:tetratricopeptide (TPR) repeat protein